MRKIFLIDNYDSFTYNLLYYLEELGCEVTVKRNDKFELDEIRNFDAILISPGPGIPQEAGKIIEVIRMYYDTKNIFGVCLGQQAIAEAFGGKLRNLTKVYHGVSSKINLTDSDIIFDNIKSDLNVGRYHSWIVDNPVPKELKVTSVDENGEIMSLKHKDYDVRGVQFHPESILTPDGKTNFRKLDKKYMKKILNRLTQYETLTENESRNIIIDISEGKLNTSQISSFLTIFMIRNITIEELNGFRKALIELSLKIDLKEFDPIDLCGTGGDEKDTFNISTLASFVTAGSGVKVAKHGNYGVSSSCGSSNVLEYLDLKFNNDSDKIRKAVDKANICFLHAPLFHPAMKNVAPVRKELGLKTFFNMLGPMVNPSMPEKQVVGVYNLELARIYNYLYQTTDINYNIIHSIDGYDEISLTNGYESLFQRK